MTSLTIGLLSPGEMGSAVGRVLRESGARVVTCVAERSQRTQRRAAEAGLQALPSLEALVEQADLVLCIVPPLAALPTAQAVARALRTSNPQPLTPNPQPPVYCDLNSIGPATAARVEDEITGAGGEFVDGSIIGNPGGLRGRTTVYLSGPGAERLQPMLAPLRTSVVGTEPGQASAFKVLYAGLTKGLSALGVELLAGAERLGLCDLLMEKYREQSDPAHFFEQTLPGLPSRSGRRAEEMIELAATLEALGLTAYTAHAAQQTLAAVAERYAEDAAPGEGTLEDFVSWWSSPPTPTLPRKGGGGGFPSPSTGEGEGGGEPQRPPMYEGPRADR